MKYIPNIQYACYISDVLMCCGQTLLTHNALRKVGGDANTVGKASLFFIASFKHNLNYLHKAEKTQPREV